MQTAVIFGIFPIGSLPVGSLGRRCGEFWPFIDLFILFVDMGVAYLS